MFTMYKQADTPLDLAAKIARKFVKATNVSSRMHDSDVVADRLTRKYGIEDTTPDNDKTYPDENDEQLSKIGNAAAVEIASSLFRKGVKGVNQKTRMDDSDAVVDRLAKKYSGKPIRKLGMRMDTLGKNTSPTNMGNSMEPPMPQTNYAKGTLDNEYNRRLNNRQYNELASRLRQENKLNNTSSSSSTSTTTTDTTGTTTGTTGTGLTTTLTFSGSY